MHAILEINKTTNLSNGLICKNIIPNKSVRQNTTSGKNSTWRRSAILNSSYLRSRSSYRVEILRGVAHYSSDVHFNKLILH